MVPQFITSNAWVAAAYTETIISSWAPYAQAAISADVAPRFTILELGAGSGKLAHGLLRVLLPRADALLGRRCASQIRYIMTDAAPSVVRGWMQQPQLMAFAQAGLMDFAVLAAERSEWAAEGIRLLYSGELWRPWEEAACGSHSDASVHPPVIAIAGYVLDSLPLDVWRVQAGAARPRAEDASSAAAAAAAGPGSCWQLLQGLVRLRWEHQGAGGSSGPTTTAKPSSSAAAIKSFRADWRFVREHEVPMMQRRDSDGEPGNSDGVACSCRAERGSVDYYQRQHRAGVAPSTAAASSSAPPTRSSAAAEDGRKAHIAALAGACAAAADRVLDWYLAHGCEVDMHEAFACDYAPPGDDPLLAAAGGSGCEADGCDACGAHERGAAGNVAASEGGGAAGLLDRLKACAPGPHSLAKAQHKLFACTRSGRPQPLPATYISRASAGSGAADGRPAESASSAAELASALVSPPAAAAACSASAGHEGVVAGAPQSPFTTFCLPIGAMRALANLLAFTTWPAHAAADATSSSPFGTTAAAGAASADAAGAGLPALQGPGFLLLCADKGLLHPSSYVGSLLPDVHRHGSFSTMVNFHALGLWTQIIANANASAGDAGAGGPGAGCASSFPSPGTASSAAAALVSTCAAGDASSSLQQQGTAGSVTAVLVSPHDDVNIKTALFALVPRPRAPSDAAVLAAVVEPSNDGGRAAAVLPAPARHKPRPAFLDLCTHGELACAADRFYSSLVAFGPSDVFDLYHALSRASPSPLLAYTYGAASGKYERVPLHAPGAGKRSSREKRSDDGGAADVAALLVAASSGGTEESSGSCGRDVHAAPAVAAMGSNAHAEAGTVAAEAETLLCSDSESESDSEEQSDAEAEGAAGAGSRRGDGKAVLRPGAAAALQRRSRARQTAKRPSSSSVSASIAHLPAIAGRHASAHRFLSLRAAVALCALLHWDGDAVHQFRGIFALRLRTLTPPRRHSLWSGMLTAWAGAYLPVLPPAAGDAEDEEEEEGEDDEGGSGGPEDGADPGGGRRKAAGKQAAAGGMVSSQQSEYDVPFDIGRIVQLGAGAGAALASSRYAGAPSTSGSGEKRAISAAGAADSDSYPSHLAAAQAWYLESMRRVSPRCPTTAFNLALCCLGLGQQGLARGWLAAALAYSGGKHVQAAQCLRELQDDDEDDDDEDGSRDSEEEGDSDSDSDSDSDVGSARESTVAGSASGSDDESKGAAAGQLKEL